MSELQTTERAPATTPAEKVIEAFGGVRVLARLLGRNPSSVVRWRQPKSEGGTGGVVPSALQGRVLTLARAQGLALTAEDLISADDDRGR
jgi:hypothetical protein